MTEIGIKTTRPMSPDCHAFQACLSTCSLHRSWIPNKEATEGSYASLHFLIKQSVYLLDRSMSKIQNLRD